MGKRKEKNHRKNNYGVFSGSGDPNNSAGQI